MSKVRSELHCTSPTTSIQVQGGTALTGPNVQELRDSRGDAGHIGGHLVWQVNTGQQNFCCPQPDWRAGLCNLLRSVFKLFKLGRLDPEHKYAAHPAKY